ncbi:MAG: glutamyl-tRNA reductase [Desulfarculaceae bacterium]
MKLILTGLNHETAALEVRECLAPEAEVVGDLLKQALGQKGVREAFMVSTCNRVELLVAVEDAATEPGHIRDWLVKDKPLSPQQVENSLYLHVNEDAVRHLFRVAASLDSMVVGEPQILGQIKQAYRQATQAGATHTVLNRLLHKTFQVAKRVRSETRIGSAALSVSSAAVDLAGKIFDPLSQRSALLIGAGEMAELAAEHLLGHGILSLNVANRTLERAVDLAKRFGRGTAFRLEDLPEALAQADIVITSTGASRVVITKAMARDALKKRRGQPLFFIDIAVPRDVEPQVSELDGCFVYDIDDLSQVVENNRKARSHEARAAERIVAEEVVKFQRWLASLEVVPTITGLTNKAEAIRQAEISRSLKDLGQLSPQQLESLQTLTKSIVKKLLHDPILFLKEQSHDKSQQTKRGQLATVQRMFKLGENGEE